MSEHYREVGKFVQLVKQMTGVSLTAMFDESIKEWVLTVPPKLTPLERECLEFWLDDRLEDGNSLSYLGIAVSCFVQDTAIHVDRYSKWLYEKQRALWEQIDMVKKYKMEQFGESP